MQDRLKYRFWHKPTNKMLGCYGFNKDFVFGDTLDGVGTTYNPAKFEDCILMQCTGLKDKNGKLIYEGDILKVKLGGYPKSSFINEAVIWDRKRWVLAHKRNCKGTPKECQHCKHCERIEARKEWFFQTGDTNFKSFYMNEIIGNIYENPELLEASNDH